MSTSQVVRFVVATIAAIAFAAAGAQMTGLESAAGNTVAEAFDNAMGIFSYGMAALSIAVGLPVQSGPAALALAPAHEAPSAPSTAVPVEGWDPATRICPSCGRRVADDRLTYCNHCGEAFMAVR